MSRQSPTGFAFSMLIEIAAVVIIVSLLPRFDLRPKASAAGPASASNFLPPSLLADFQRPGYPKRQLPAPPLVQPPAERDYVEQRLDRASQQLVNSVGSAMTSVASNVTQALQTPPRPTATDAPPAQPERQVTLLPPMASPPSPSPAGSFPTQPRPWLGY